MKVKRGKTQGNRSPHFLVATMSWLGIFSGLWSILAMLIYPQDRDWVVYALLSVIFFFLVKSLKMLLNN